MQIAALELQLAELHRQAKGLDARAHKTWKTRDLLAQVYRGIADVKAEIDRLKLGEPEGGERAATA